MIALDASEVDSTSDKTWIRMDPPKQTSDESDVWTFLTQEQIVTFGRWKYAAEVFDAERFTIHMGFHQLLGSFSNC